MHDDSCNGELRDANFGKNSGARGGGKVKGMSSKTERTFIMVKVDGVQRGLIGEIIKRFEQKGYKLVALKFLKVRGCCTVLVKDHGF